MRSPSERHERVVSVPLGRVATSTFLAVVAGCVRHKVEFWGNYDLTVELLNRLRPGVWTEMVIVDAQTALVILTLVVVPARF